MQVAKVAINHSWDVKDACLSALQHAEVLRPLWVALSWHICSNPSHSSSPAEQQRRFLIIVLY